MKKKPSMILIGTFMVLVTILIAGLLGHMSQMKTAANLLVETQKFVAVSATSQIEFAIGVGKPLERFYGADDILKGVYDDSENILAIWLSDDTGNVLYSYPADFVTSGYQLDEHEQYKEVPAAEAITAASPGVTRVYYCELPVLDAGTIGMLLDGTQVTIWMDQYTDLVRVYVPVLTIAAFLVFLLLKLRFEIDKKIVIGVLALSQVSLLIVTFNYFQNSYYNELDKMAEIISRVIERDVARLISAGIAARDFVDFDLYLQDIADHVPVLSHIQTNLTASNISSMDLSSQWVELYGVIDMSIIRSALLGNIIDAVVLTAIVIFLMLELLFFLSTEKVTKNVQEIIGATVSEGDNESIRVTSGKDTQEVINIRASRLFFFILYAGVGICVSFLAAISYRFAMQSDFGNEIMIGVPVTAEMLAGILAIAFSGKILVKIGAKKTLYASVLICGCAAVISGISSELIMFTVARAVTGFGFALATITGRILAASQQEEETRSQMLASLIGGTIIGFCCGAVIGGLLNDRFGFTFAFLLSAVIIIICIPLISRMGISNFRPSGGFSGSDILSILKTPKSVAFLVLVVLPVYAAGSFISFGVPLLGAIMGLSSTIISALIMANSLITAYLAPLSVKIINKLMSVDKSVLVYGTMIAAALFLAVILPTIPVLVCVVVLLGIADSFGLVTLIESFASGGENAGTMISLTLTGRVGQTVAPSAIAASGTPLILAIAMAAGTILFALFNRRYKKG
ncbi:MAG: MFS transporter [Oscillospiraceae bacterium]|jgi:MFS family permease|nr:MFS transporter [Oscillospiraceae bacterium]